jgi:uncharacterized protein YutE (UPF0331/DUF86 family)
LDQIAKKATEEKEILDELAKKEQWDRYQLRAAKSSMQLLVEALIGKSKKILKHYNCPIIPQRSKDAVYILHEVGAISDEEYQTFHSAIGFRNAPIHDYLDFDDKILIKLVKDGRYKPIYDFLVRTPKFDQVILRRIENFTL